MDQLRVVSQRAETILNSVASPLKPYLSHIGRFLLVVTFLEDALRIFMQWEEQVRFMMYYRSCHRSVANVFLFSCFSMMLGGSLMALARFRPAVACGLMAGVVVLQTIGYGLYSHTTFMMRNVSLLGGILLLWVEANMNGGKRHKGVLFPGLPDITETEKSTYLSLMGRLLLVGLFVALGFHGEFTPFKVIMAAFSLLACLMVAVGFKARYSAMFLVAILSIFNIIINPWWSYGEESAERDFLRYDFFQMLSIMGGFLLLANTGPGELSVDEKHRKSF